jgi:hypothetical protein
MAFGKRDGGGRRISKRVDAPQPALLVALSDRHRALLFNISRTGAMLRAENAPPTGTELFLQVGDLEVFARVVWKRGEECGIAFERDIRDWEIKLVNFEANRGTKGALKPAEKGGADDWLGGVAR